MGFRALCCSKEDNTDDDQDLAVRPTQPGPMKSPRNVSASVRKETSLTDTTPPEKSLKESAPEQPIVGQPVQEKLPQDKRDLWKEAYNGLDSSQQKYVAASSGPPLVAIQQVIDDTTKKYDEWQKGGLKIHRKSGNDIDLRACAEGIIGAAIRASSVISTAVSFDPTGHASSAWTIISFGMSIVQNRLDRRDAIFAASEFLAETLAYYALVDQHYRNQKVGSDEHIDQALLRVYSAILSYSAEVKKGGDENQGMRTLRSVLSLTDQPLSQLKETVTAQNKNADKWVKISANLGDRKHAAEHLAKTDAILADMKSLKAKAFNKDEEDQLDWISKADFSRRQRDLQKRKTDDTGLWLLELPEYNDWKSRSGNLLLLPGDSGCGKSVLCSTVIGDIEEDCSSDPTKRIAYWYFQFGDEATQKIENMTRSMIRQLSRSPVAPAVTKLFEDHNRRGSQPEWKVISNVFDNQLSNIDGTIYLVFDALDECPDNPKSKERGPLLSLIEGLLERHKDKIHVLATSRPEQDIKQRFDRFPQINIKAYLDEDVKAFVSSCISQPPLNIWKTDIRNLILERLLSSKERRFRWAELQLKELEECYDEDDVRKALDSVPQTLGESYQKVLDRIKPKDVPRARQILTLICLSPELLPLKVVAGMVGLGNPGFVVSICTTSLVSVIDMKIQAAHFSVQEFLILSEENGQHHPCQFSVASGHKLLAEKTVDYLLEQTEELTRETAMENPFIFYAAKNWEIHVAALRERNQLNPSLQAKVCRLFTESNVYFNWIRAEDANSQSWSKLLQEYYPPLHTASELGVLEVVKTLLDQGADPSQSVDIYWHPKNSYILAAENGHFDVLESFLNRKPHLEKQTVERILSRMNYRETQKAKLASVLEQLYYLGALREESTDDADTIGESFIMSAMSPGRLDKMTSLRILNIFLDWRPRISFPVTDDILLHAICSDREALRVLLERCDFSVSPNLLEKIHQSPHMTKYEGIAELAIRRPSEVPISPRFFEEFANQANPEAMESLLQLRKSDLCVTSSVLERAAGNFEYGTVIRLLWPYREPGIEVNEKMIEEAVTNFGQSREVISFLMEKIQPGLSLSAETVERLVYMSTEGLLALRMLLTVSAPEVFMSEKIVQCICDLKEATEMLGLLVDQGFEIPITDAVVSSAAFNQHQGPSLIRYLTQLHQGHIPVTEQALIAATRNREAGGKVLEILLQDASSNLVTDKVFEGASHNKDAMQLLLKQRQGNLPIHGILKRMTVNSMYSKDVLQLLFERKLVNVDDSVVETLAADNHTLGVLLSWKPDIAITEKVLIAGVENANAMRLLLGVQGNTTPITEDILVRAAQLPWGLESLKVMQLRRGPIPITEKVIRTAIESGLGETVGWFLEQMSETFVTNFWEENRDDDDLDGDCWQEILRVYLEKTQSKITDSMLQAYPRNTDWAGGFDSFIWDNHNKNGIFELPSTPLAAEAVVERCGNRTIEKFLQVKQIPVTDRLVQVADKNTFTKGKESLMSFLKQKAAAE